MNFMKKFKELPKDIRFYLITVISSFLVLFVINVYILLFTQFRFLNIEYDKVSKLEVFIFEVSDSYYKALSRNSDLKQEDLQKILDDTVKSLSDKDNKFSEVLSNESNFNYTALSNNSFRFCYGFKTSPDFREKYGIIRKDPDFNADWVFKWMPAWLRITKESNNVSDTKYIDCYNVDFYVDSYRLF